MSKITLLEAKHLESMLHDYIDTVIHNINNSDRKHKFTYIGLWKHKPPVVVFSDSLFFDWSKQFDSVPPIEIIMRTDKLPPSVDKEYIEKMFMNETINHIY